MSHSREIPGASGNIGPYQTRFEDKTTAPVAHNYVDSPPRYEKNQGENASYYNPECNLPSLGESEDERGLGSTLAGGAAGGVAAHKMGGGKLATAAAATAGAIGANWGKHQLYVD